MIERGLGLVSYLFRKNKALCIRHETLHEGKFYSYMYLKYVKRTALYINLQCKVWDFCYGFLGPKTFQDLGEQSPWREKEQDEECWELPEVQLFSPSKEIANGTHAHITRCKYEREFGRI